MELNRQGWQLRWAVPRHDLVWSRELTLSPALRALVLPDRTAGLASGELEALLMVRMAQMGLSSDGEMPDPALIRSANDKLLATLAPSWLGRGRPLEFITTETCAHGNRVEDDRPQR